MSEKGRSAKALRRRLIPYGLLGPGAIWLVVFFLVPLYFMGEMSLRSGVPNTPAAESKSSGPSTTRGRRRSSRC